MIRQPAFHPLLLAVYPVLQLLALNLGAVSPRAAVGPFVVCLVAAVVVWAVCGLVLRSRGRGALWASLFWVLFFSHGHVLGWLGGGVTAAWALVAVGAVVFATIGWLLGRRSDGMDGLNKAVNVPAVVLTLMALGPIIAGALNPPRNLPSDENTPVEAVLGYLSLIHI